jgi:4-hydroxy-2-oxoheptanedioate aldolase
MPGNKIIESMRAGRKAVGLDLSFYSDEMIELSALMGLDFVRYDGQHAPITPETIDRFCRLCDGFGLTPAMRVPDQIPSNILNYLDRGIKAITVPNLETREQAEALVECCYFAPIGLRSFTSQRVMRYGLRGDSRAVMRDANADLLLIPQLESITAYENLEEILTVEGIEVFAGGPNDLAQSMGHPGEPDHPDCLRVTEEGREKILAAGKRFDGDVTATTGATAAVQGAIGTLLEAQRP